MTYDSFLETKIKRIEDAGFEIDQLNNILFDFQQHIVKKALKKGRFAIFANTGLGKTFMQLEWAKHVKEYTNKPVLLLNGTSDSTTPVEQSRELEPRLKNGKLIEFEEFEHITPNIQKKQGKAIMLEYSKFLSELS